jgi:hypothetical protein
VALLPARTIDNRVSDGNWIDPCGTARHREVTQMEIDELVRAVQTLNAEDASAPA